MAQPLVIPPRLWCTLRSRELVAREEATLAFDECQRSTVEATQQVLDQCETFEDRFRVIRNSEAIHPCAAFENLTFINMLSERLPKPSSQTRIFLNHLDKGRCTPLIVCARNIPKMRALHDADDAEKAREFLQSIIRPGAAVYVSHATTGLSPLGYFREEFRDHARWHNMNGIEDPDAEARQVQSDQIERILMPGSYATEADDAVVRADREDRAMNDFDEEEWDEDDWGEEERNEEEWQEDEGDY